MNKTLYTKRDGMRAFTIVVGVAIAFQFCIGLAFNQGLGTGVAYWVVNAIYSICIGATALLYAFLTKRNIPTVTKIDKAPPVLHTMFAVLSVFFLINFMTPINQWLCDLIEKIGLTRPSVDIPSDNIFALIAVACVLPAFTEEFIFRGTIGNGLADGSRKKIGAILASGALFALFHLNPAQTLHQFILGCLLTLFVMRSNSLWVAVIVHFFNNICTVVLSFTVEPTGFYQTYDWIIVLVAGVLFALSLVGYFVFAKDKRAVKNGTDAEFIAVENISVADKVLFISTIVVCLLLWTTNLFV